MFNYYGLFQLIIQGHILTIPYTKYPTDSLPLLTLTILTGLTGANYKAMIIQGLLFLLQEISSKEYSSTLFN